MAQLHMVSIQIVLDASNARNQESSREKGEEVEVTSRYRMRCLCHTTSPLADVFSDYMRPRTSGDLHCT